jgi:thiol-disulfide isomerase/thioredoxin
LGEGSMKKIAIIVVTVVVLIGITIYADRATRVQGKTGKVVLSVGAAAVGKPEPELKLKDLDGRDLALSDLKGKVVFVNFWATWCGPCQDEIPDLIAMQNKYASKGFTVVGIAMDEEGKSVVAPFVAKQLYDVEGQKLHINYPIVLGTDEASDKFGGILGYPTSFLLSRNGTQIMKFQGPPDMDVIAKAVDSSE